MQKSLRILLLPTLLGGIFLQGCTMATNQNTYQQSSAENIEVISSSISPQASSAFNSSLTSATSNPSGTSGDYLLGDPKAQYSLVEYSTRDSFDAVVDKSFRSKLLSKNKNVNWSHRNFMVSMFVPSMSPDEGLVGNAEECAGQLGSTRGFWQFVEKFSENIYEYEKIQTTDSLAAIAVSVGLPKQKFSDCLNGSRYTQKIKEETALAEKAGINAEPEIMLINNTTGEKKIWNSNLEFVQNIQNILSK